MPSQKLLILQFLFFTALNLSACSNNGQTTTPVGNLPRSENSSTVISVNPTPSLEATTNSNPSIPSEPRTLTICMGNEPDSLYFYGNPSMAKNNIFDAIYDGPLDYVNFRYQSVILEKIPSLADGDALLQPVPVSDGEVVVDARGNLTPLGEGVAVYPSGCQSPECIQHYSGGEIQMDQLVVRFKLLAGTQWADGQPLTAQDSIFSFQIDSDPDTPTSKYRVQRTTRYTALDEQTVEWVGLPGYRDPTYPTNFWHPLPRHVLNNFSPKELLTAEIASKQPLGWGPYTITDWTSGDQIRLEKNPFYFRANEGIPHFDTLIFRFSTGDETNASWLISRACDILDSTFIDFNQLEDLNNKDQSGQIKIQAMKEAIFEFAAFGIVPAAYDDGNQFGVDRPDFFGDVRTRRAIAYCLNRTQFLESRQLGILEIAHTFLPGDHPLFNPNVVQYPYDPAAGMGLLDEVGWRDTDGNSATPRVAQGVSNVPDGTPLSFDYWTTNAARPQQIGQIISSSLAQCGIETHLSAWEMNDLFVSGPGTPLFGRKFDMAQIAWLIGEYSPCDLFLTEQIPGNDPEKNLYLWAGINPTGYSNLEYDLACQLSLTLMPGQPGYEEAYNRVQAIFAEDLPVIPLYFHVRWAASRPDLCGLGLASSTFSDFWNLEAYDYGQGCN